MWDEVGTERQNKTMDNMTTLSNRYNDIRGVACSVWRVACSV